MWRHARPSGHWDSACRGGFAVWERDSITMLPCDSGAACWQPHIC